MSVKITHDLILQIRDDAELTAMARIIEGAQREAQWQGFGSDWDKARVSAYMLRAAGFGRVAESDAEATGHQDAEHLARDTVTALPPVQSAQSGGLPEDERHTVWCRGDHEGRCRRGRLSGTEK